MLILVDPTDGAFLVTCCMHTPFKIDPILADVSDGYGSIQDGSYMRKVGGIAPKGEMGRKASRCNGHGLGDQKE